MKNKLFLGLAILPVMLLADMDRCVSCHGVDFEKKALGTSKIVKNMSESEIKAALDGYKAGKGGPQKDIMIKEVNVGVDTDAMAADVYNEIHTPGFEEPDPEFIFKKRRSVKTIFKIKQTLKKLNSSKESKKVYGQIKSFAFDIYSYNSYARKKVDFNTIKPIKIKPDEVLKRVTEIKKCVDHSFTEEALAKCQSSFIELGASLSLMQAEKLKKKIKPKEKKHN